MMISHLVVMRFRPVEDSDLMIVPTSCAKVKSSADIDKSSMKPIAKSEFSSFRISL